MERPHSTLTLGKYQLTANQIDFNIAPNLSSRLPPKDSATPSRLRALFIDLESWISRRSLIELRSYYLHTIFVQMGHSIVTEIYFLSTSSVNSNSSPSSTTFQKVIIESYRNFDRLSSPHNAHGLYIYLYMFIKEYQFFSTSSES